MLLQTAHYVGLECVPRMCCILSRSSVCLMHTLSNRIRLLPVMNSGFKELTGRKLETSIFHEGKLLSLFDIQSQLQL